MRLEDAKPEDVDEATVWLLEKAKAFEVPLQDFDGASFVKVEDAFYCATKPALLIGPLIPKPGVAGKRLGLALWRMIKEIRKQYAGDIIYLTRGKDGIDELAGFYGFERIEAGLMRLKGTL